MRHQDNSYTRKHASKRRNLNSRRHQNGPSIDSESTWSAVVDWNDEPDVDDDEYAEGWMPPSRHTVGARRRLERYLEKIRLAADLREVFDDDPDKASARRNERHKRKRYRQHTDPNT